MAFQRTLKSPIQCTGVGLHSGAPVSMRLKPAPAGSGISFLRTDVAARIPARWDRVVDTRLCTVLGSRAGGHLNGKEGGTTVGTVEHLMAAFAGCGIDNAVVELDGPEVPIMDGSSAPFVFLIDCAGTAEQEAPRRALRILKEVHVADGARSVCLAPSPVPLFSFEIEFENDAIRRQEVTLAMTGGRFKTDIARARTFGFLHEVDLMRQNGFARGGSLDNAVVISGSEVLNQGGLRYSDEFVRHKLLDAVGDLALAGGTVLGHFHGVRSGHTLNNKLLRALFADRTAWAWEEDELASQEVWPERIRATA